MNSLIPNIRKLPRLYHFSISVRGGSSDSFVKSMQSIKNVTCLGLPQSKLPSGTISSLESLSSLNLSQCYLDSRSIVILSEALKHTKTLVKLDLSYNGITTNIGRYIAIALRLNYSLGVLNLSHNDLDDGFCAVLAEELKRNSILYECDMSGNPFGQQGAQDLMRLIGTTGISSLGDLDQNKSLSIVAREQLKGSLGTFKNEYKLLSPIEETNPYGYSTVLPWNLTNNIE
jgi:hypothetical protein